MIDAGDIKLMHDRLIAVQCCEPYDSTIVDEACDMLLTLADELRKFGQIRTWACAEDDLAEAEWQEGYDAAKRMARALLLANVY